MKLRTPILTFAFTLILAFFNINIFSQTLKIDSIIQDIEKRITNRNLDSTHYTSAFQVIAINPINKSQLEKLEKLAIQSAKLNPLYSPFEIRTAIFYSLIQFNDPNAITYGKKLVEELDVSTISKDKEWKLLILNELRFPFRNSKLLDDGFQYFNKKVTKYKAQNDSTCLAECYFVLGGFYMISGVVDLAIYNMKKSISYIDSSKSKGKWLNNIGVLGNYYLLKGDYTQSRKYLGISFKEYYKDKQSYGFVALQLARVMISTNHLDSAAYFINVAKTDPENQNNVSFVASLQMEAYFKVITEDFEGAEELLKKSWQLIWENNIPVNASSGIIAPDYYLALVRIKQNRIDEAIELLKKDIDRLLNNRSDIIRDYKLIAELYKKSGKFEKSADSYARFMLLQDSLIDDQDRYRTFNFETEQQMNEKELSISNLENQNKITAITRNFSIGIAVLLLLIAAGIYSRFYSKKKLNKALEKTLSELKSTQSQLVQQEKLASLGALTAGIAHEIKNPLNFVNNFSELSSELVDEFIETTDETERQEIGADLKINLQKINEHGKRADSIVKNMLQHSRSGAGEKQLTDINQLCEEYLNLAFHGKRATDAGFNCEMLKNLDNTLPHVNCVIQDISRVILNLINNAFDAVREREVEGKTPNYKPSVIITTQQTNNSISISIQDNGKGIPQPIKEKIFEPFFTTKPAGQGTGLGLSLSYDIVKAHGGEMKVESIENDGAAFIISLPF